MNYRKTLKGEAERLLKHLDSNCGLLSRQLGTPSKSREANVGDLFAEVKATKMFLKANTPKSLKNLSDLTLEQLIADLEERNSSFETHIAEKHAFRWGGAFDAIVTDGFKSVATTKTNPNGAAPVAGQMMIDPVTSKASFFNGTQWKEFKN